MSSTTGCAGAVQAIAVRTAVAVAGAEDAAVEEVALVVGVGVALASVSVWPPPPHAARNAVANAKTMMRTNDMMERVALRAH